MVDRKPTFDQILTEGDEQEILSACITAFEAANNARMPFEQKWKEDWKQYRTYLDPKEWPYQSNLALPMSFAAIETIVPRCVAGTPRANVKPLVPDVVEAAKKQEDWLNHVSSEPVTQFRGKTRCWVRDALIYGSGIVKTFYRYETRTSYEMQAPVKISADETGFLSAEEDHNSDERELVSKSYLYKDNPDFDVVSPFDFYPAPLASDIDGAEYVIHKSLIPYREVVNMVESEAYEKRVLEQLEYAWHTHEDTHYRRILADEIGEGFAGDGADDLIRPVLVWEVWAEPGLRATILNRSIVANLTDIGRHNVYSHGEKPFVKLDDYETNDQFWGISTLEVVQSVQHEIDAVRNQRMDGVRLALSPMYAYRSGTIDMSQMEVRPGGLVEIHGIERLDDVIMELPRPGVPPVAYQETEALMNVFNQTVGVTDYARGQDSPTRDTATEVNAKVEGTNSRFALKQENIDSAVSRVWHQWQLMAKQFHEESFIPLDRARQPQEDPFFMMSKEDFSLDVRIAVQPASMQETQQQRRVESLERLNLVFSSPEILAHLGPEGQRKMLHDWLVNDGLVDADSYLQGQGPMDPMMQQMMAGGGQPPAQMGQEMPAGLPPEMAGAPPMQSGQQPPGPVPEQVPGYMMPAPPPTGGPPGSGSAPITPDQLPTILQTLGMT